MSAEKIFRALGLLGDDLVAEAEEKRLPKPQHKRRWAAAAAALAVTAGLGTGGAWLLSRMGGNAAGGVGKGPEEGNPDGGASAFMSYSGPVFPLSLEESTEGVFALRELTYDFSPWEAVWVSNEEQLAGRTDLSEEELSQYALDLERLYPEGGYEESSEDLLVTDRYILHNTLEEDIKTGALYPFAGSFSNLFWCTPAVSVNGEQVEATLFAGGYSGGFTGAMGDDDPEGSLNLQDIDSWEGYRALLQSGEYRENALARRSYGEVPVTVYEFTDWSAPHEQFPAATQAVSFTLGADSQVLSCGFEGMEWDESGFRRYSYFVPDGKRRSTGSKLLAVVGEAPEEYSLQGYQDGGCKDGEEVEAVSCTVTRYETTLRDLLERLTREYLEEYGAGKDMQRTDWSQAGLFQLYVDTEEELLYRYGLFSEDGAQRYESGRLEDIIGESGNQRRIFYLAFEADIPAGGEAEISAAMTKKGSFNFYCGDRDGQDLYGYDMVTQLDSGIDFREVKARLLNPEPVEIVNQNYGFDPAAGVTEAELDPATEHYYMEVRRAEGEQ